MKCAFLLIDHLDTLFLTCHEQLSNILRLSLILSILVAIQAFRLLMRVNPRAVIILSLLVFSGVLYVGASTSPILVFVFCICTLSLFFSVYLTKWVLAKDEGPPEMSEV